MAVKKKHDVFLGLCKDCAHAYDPHSLSLKGEPTLARCPFEQYSVLWQRGCINGQFKTKKYGLKKSEK